MSQDFPQIIPSEQSQVEENLLVHQTTREFYDEVQIRSEFQQYCQWYYDTAEHHRQELEKMRGELNIFAWFRRK